MVQMKMMEEKLGFEQLRLELNKGLIAFLVPHISQFDNFGFSRNLLAYIVPHVY